jgi:hypothetical protein
MTELSQAAFDVRDAAEKQTDLDFRYAPTIAAAVLKAAANNRNEFEVPFDVVDEWEKVKGSCNSFYAAAKWGREQVLQELLNIAAELDPHHNK